MFWPTTFNLYYHYQIDLIGKMITYFLPQTYLTDEEFQKIFGKTVSEFNALPEWKRKDLKKKMDLF